MVMNFRILRNVENYTSHDMIVGLQYFTKLFVNERIFEEVLSSSKVLCQPLNICGL
jgi:hypothetical protein